MTRLTEAKAIVTDSRWVALVARIREAEGAAQRRKFDSYFKRCPPIAFVKRHHFKSPGAGGVLLCWDVFRPGGGIYTYDPSRPKLEEREIFRRDNGVVFDMTASFDARKLLFSYRDCTPDDSFHIYEINVDGTGLRQITTGRYHDVSPFYLPGGKIGFVSTRVKSFSMCQDAAASALHVMDADGKNIRRIQFGTLADLSPHVLDDGSILFTRWEYQDKSVFTVQSLWTINPDGTRLNLFYGNTITIPNTIWQAKPIPGTKKLLCTMAPHHGNLVGAIGIVDRRLGQESPKAMRNITPEIPYTPSVDPNWRPGDQLYYWSYRDPYPIDKELFLVAYGGGGVQRYRLFLLDDKGEKVRLWEDERISCFSPIPLVARRQPPNINSALPTSKVASGGGPGMGHGTFLLMDVYQGLNGVNRGQVAAIRVMSQVAKPTNNRGRRAYFKGHDIVDPVIGAGTFYVKHNYGTVPVGKDGSAYFKAPAGVELYFQALDVDGKELSRMGSITQLQPGETQSCIGCHESRSVAPSQWRPSASAIRRGPVDITPPPWGAGPVDFVRHVQPGLDKYCVKCHSGVDPDGDIDLSGDKTRHFNIAYDNLLRRSLVNFFYLTPPQEETGNFQPLKTGSHVSKVVSLIEKGHGAVKMDDDSRRRLYTWIEANVPYYGTYEHTRPGTPGSRDAWWGKPWLQRDIASIYHDRCASCHGQANPQDAHSETIHPTWINLTHPRYSRMLNAPLAKTAGGIQRCKAKDGAAVVVFKNKLDPGYQAMLEAIRQGKKSLDDKPRFDMPGAKPSSYEQDFGRLFGR